MRGETFGSKEKKMKKTKKKKIEKGEGRGWYEVLNFCNQQT